MSLRSSSLRSSVSTFSSTSTPRRRLGKKQRSNAGKKKSTRTDFNEYIRSTASIRNHDADDSLATIAAATDSNPLPIALEEFSVPAAFAPPAQDDSDQFVACDDDESTQEAWSVHMDTMEPQQAFLDDDDVFHFDDDQGMADAFIINLDDPSMRVQPDFILFGHGATSDENSVIFWTLDGSLA
jgi:hypothetical protein